MNMRKKAVPLALALAFALGAGGTGITLAQDMAGGMVGDDSGMGMMDREDRDRENSGGMMNGEGGMGMMGHGPGRGMMQEMHAMREMLSAEQPDELRELMQEQRPAQFERMEQAKSLREELMAELQQERPDPDSVHELHGRMAEIHGEMMVERVRMRNAMYDLLTEEQREQLADKTPDGAVVPNDHDAHHNNQ